MTDNARARLSAYMTHESDQDQAEFDTRVDAAITEATKDLQAKLAEVASSLDYYKSEAGKWFAVEPLITEAHEKDNPSIDTYDLASALGWEA